MADATAERPRILRIITRLNVGGPARHVFHLAEGMRGFETLLAAGLPEPSEGELGPPAGVAVRILPRLGRPPSLLDDLASLWALWRLCREFRPAIVHTHTAKAGALGRLAARLAGVPIVLHTFHGHVLRGYFPPWQSRLLAGLERLLAMLSTRIYALSPSQKAELAAFGVAPDAKIRVVPLGLDLAPLAPPLPRGALRRALGLPEQAVLIGCVARMVAIKDHGNLLEAFSKVASLRPEAHLILIGGGLLESEIAGRIAELGLVGRVHKAGWQTDLPKVYGDLDLCVLSSRNEGLPVCLIEAAAAGVPIVATRVGGVGDLLGGHPAAGLVPPGDSGALAGVLEEALSDLPRRRALALEASDGYRSRYDRARLVQDLAREYLELLGMEQEPA